MCHRSVTMTHSNEITKTKSNENHNTCSVANLRSRQIDDDAVENIAPYAVCGMRMIVTSCQVSRESICLCLLNLKCTHLRHACTFRKNVNFRTPARLKNSMCGTSGAPMRCVISTGSLPTLLLRFCTHIRRYCILGLKEG